MSYYDKNSPISFYDDDDIEAAVGDSQLHADEDDITDALNGDFDDIMDFNNDELDDMMDADDDLMEMQGLPDEDVITANSIVEECQGALEDGAPKAAITVSLDLVNPETYAKQTLATLAMYKPLVNINKRFDFIEILLTFPTAIDSQLKVLYAHLEKYGQKVNELTEASTMIPLMSFTIVPIAGMGCYYVVGHNPVLWALQSEKVGAAPTQMKVIVRCEDVHFFQTDETNLADIHAAVLREQEQESEYLDAIERKEEEERRAREASATAFLFDTDYDS